MAQPPSRAFGSGASGSTSPGSSGTPRNVYENEIRTLENTIQQQARMANAINAENAQLRAHMMMTNSVNKMLVECANLPEGLRAKFYAVMEKSIPNRLQSLELDMHEDVLEDSQRVQQLRDEFFVQAVAEVQREMAQYTPIVRRTSGDEPDPEAEQDPESEPPPNPNTEPLALTEHGHTVWCRVMAVCQELVSWD